MTIEKVLHGVMQQKRKNGPALGFEAYVAPVGFDRTAQPVDIYTVFNTYYNTNNTAKYIFKVYDAAVTTTLGDGTSYRWAQTVGGTETVTDVASSTGTITWTAGSTKRWVIVNHTTMTPKACVVAGDSTTRAEWLYCGNCINSIKTAYTANASKIKWIHIHDVDNLTSIPAWAHDSNTSLTGVLNMGVSITSIGNYSFNPCTGITGTITIPNSVTTIAQSAFRGMTGITSVSFGSGITSIGTYAFASMSNLSGNVSFPNSLVTISGLAFYNDTSITGMTWGTGITTIGDRAFMGCTSTTGTLTIPASLTSLAAGAFALCKFTDLDVSANAGYAKSDYVLYDLKTASQIKANYSCRTNANTITFRNDTTSILDYCCYYNSRTGALTIPDLVTSIGYVAFQNCIGITSLTLGSAVVSIGNSAFISCTGIAGTVTFPSSVTTIGPAAFEYDAAITSFVLSPNVTVYSREVFYACNNAVINDPDFSSVVTLDFQAFVGVTFTGDLVLPSTLTTLYTTGIGTTFTLTKVNFDSITSSSTNYPVSDNVLYDVKTAGVKFAFFGARSYSGSLTLRSDTTKIGIYAFYKSANRTGSLTIPNTVTVIEGGAFQECTGFTSISIGTGVTSVPGYMCYGCTLLAGTLTINSVVTALAGSAFKNCALTRVDSYPTTAPTTGVETFDNNAMELHVPTGGGTGYGVAPWTTAAIFATKTADL